MTSIQIPLWLQRKPLRWCMMTSICMQYSHSIWQIHFLPISPTYLVGIKNLAGNIPSYYILRKIFIWTHQCRWHNKIQTLPLLYKYFHDPDSKTECLVLLPTASLGRNMLTCSVATRQYINKILFALDKTCFLTHYKTIQGEINLLVTSCQASLLYLSHTLAEVCDTLAHEEVCPEGFSVLFPTVGWVDFVQLCGL